MTDNFKKISVKMNSKRTNHSRHREILTDQSYTRRRRRRRRRADTWKQSVIKINICKKENRHLFFFCSSIIILVGFFISSFLFQIHIECSQIIWIREEEPTRQQKRNKKFLVKNYCYRDVWESCCRKVEWYCSGFSLCHISTHCSGDLTINNQCLSSSPDADWPNSKPPRRKK